MRLVDPEENTDVLNRYGNTGASANSKAAAILAGRQAECSATIRMSGLTTYRPKVQKCRLDDVSYDLSFDAISF